MTHSPETSRQSVEAALRVLDAEGYDVKPLWQALSTRIADHERGVPDVDDVKYLLPTVPPTTAQHFDGSRPQPLTASSLWQGFSYSLTKGQRNLLRESYGLTPTMTVTCGWVETWPGTQHPRAMCLVSDVHVDPKNRRHVLTKATIRNVGRFFRLAEEMDAVVDVNPALALPFAWLEVGRVAKLTNEERWTIEDLAGVKIKSKVEVVSTTADRFTLLCLHSGNRVTLVTKDYYAAVEELVRLSESATPTRKRSVEVNVTDELAKLAAELS